MQCADFESRLNELLDARRPPQGDVSLAEHSMSCAACATLLHDCDTVLESLAVARGAGSSSVQPSPDFAQRVVAQWTDHLRFENSRSDDQRPQTLPLRTRRIVVRRWGALAAAAAAILVAVSSFVWQQNRNSQELAQVGQIDAVTSDSTLASDAVVAASIVPADATQEKPESAQANQVALTELAAQAYRPLMEETREGLRNALEWLPLVSPESGNFTAVDKLGPAIGPQNASADSANGPRDAAAPVELTLLDSPITGGIAPMAQSAVRSVAVLLRVLPNSSQPINQ